MQTNQIHGKHHPKNKKIYFQHGLPKKGEKISQALNERNIVPAATIAVLPDGLHWLE